MEQLGPSLPDTPLTPGIPANGEADLPGSTKSEGVAKLVMDLFPDLSPEAAERKFTRENRPTSLIERLLEPEEIANLTVYVCSPMASGINGAALRVDGGLIRSES